MEDEKKIKEKMFGKVRPPEGGYVPNIGLLLRAFEKPNSVAWMFCTECGLYFEISQEFLNRFKDKLTEHKGYYFETKGCRICGRGGYNPTRKEIPLS